MKTLEDMERDAGEDLTKRILEIFIHTTCATITEQEIANWFYKPIKVLEGNSPYDCCKRGDKKMVENLLKEYESGVFSV